MENCAFCRIVRGELPSVKLFEDDRILAFLDVAPINPGHSLIIPKEHHASLTTVPDALLEGMMRLVPRLGQAVVRVVDGDGFNLHLANGQCAGQVILHTHLHVIPRLGTDGFSWGWRSRPYASEDERIRLAGKIYERLDGLGPL
jgi:histidine triad (HIT) family protein